MAQIPLVSDQIESGARFLRLFDARIPVKAAFWVNREESCPWYLYVASEKITDANVRDAYGEVFHVVDENVDLSLDPFEIRLISASSPMARDALRLRGPRPGVPTHYYGSSLGGEAIEGAYIYPSPMDRVPS